MFETILVIAIVAIGVYIARFNPRLLCFDTPSGMHGDVEIHYFGGSRGRAESIRLLLEYAGVSYKEIHYTRADWVKVKKNGLFPFQQMPLLIHGTEKIAQSSAINRYIARRTGIAGSNDTEVTIADELSEFVEDMRKPYGALVYNSSAPSLKTTFIQDSLVLYFSILETRLAHGVFYGGGKHFVGMSYTYADLMLYDIVDCYRRLVDDQQSLKGDEICLWCACLTTLSAEKFPNLTGFMEKVENVASIRKYISSKRKEHCNGPSAFLDAAN
jgi:glutathione S-transferase